MGEGGKFFQQEQIQLLMYFFILMLLFKLILAIMQNPSVSTFLCILFTYNIYI